MLKASLVTKQEMKKLLGTRRKDSCKNDYGHIFVLAGSPGMTGAATLASQAVMRVGAGLVTLGIPKTLNPILEVKLTEVMTLPLPETEDGKVSKNAYDEIIQFLDKRRVSTLIIGPGLSTSEETMQLVKKIIENVELPCVLDADGINAFKEESGTRENKWQIPELKTAKSKLVITPHPGELGRLINESVQNIQQDRVKYATSFAKENGVIVVLKGYQTVITNGIQVFINPTGNPGMATAGCGDVLAGIIGGLIAQLKDKSLLETAKLGVYLHGLAGDLAAQDKTEMGLIASDVLENIPLAIKKLRGK